MGVSSSCTPQTELEHTDGRGRPAPDTRLRLTLHPWESPSASQSFHSSSRQDRLESEGLNLNRRCLGTKYLTVHSPF